MIEVCHGVDVIEVCALRLARELSVDLGGGLGGILSIGSCGTDLINEILLVLNPCLLVGFWGEEARDTVFSEVFTALILVP